MSWALANLWNSPIAQTIARDISTMSGLYCGPAAVGWIAAVWNDSKGRPYDYMKRLKDKDLFPEGPRPFNLNLPGFQTNLSEILKRETANELKLLSDTYHRYGSIHDLLAKHSMPFIIRMLAPTLRGGLHYATLYKSERHHDDLKAERIQFYWQDNGLYDGRSGSTSGLSKTEWRNPTRDIFVWGAKRVVPV